MTLSILQRIKIRWLLLPALALLAAGFLWGAYFVGVPYQDPTPEQIAAWRYNFRIVMGLYKAGKLLAALAILLWFVKLLTKYQVRMRWLFLTAAILFIGSFLWGVFFVGLPYQDATPAQIATHRFRMRIWDYMMEASALLVAIGLVIWIARRWVAARSH